MLKIGIDDHGIVEQGFARLERLYHRNSFSDITMSTFSEKTDTVIYIDPRINGVEKLLNKLNNQSLILEEINCKRLGMTFDNNLQLVRLYEIDRLEKFTNTFLIQFNTNSISALGKSLNANIIERFIRVIDLHIKDVLNY